MSASRPSARDRVAGAARWVLAPARTGAVRGFERLIGVESKGDIPQTGWVALWALFRALEVREGDAFADLGSGRGRVLFMAARRPFARVIGVDRSPEFNRLAEANLERTRHRLRSKSVEVVEADLRDWPIPDDITVLYLYAPLDQDLVRDLIARVEASATRRPREIRLIYTMPEEIEPLLSAWRLERLRDLVPRYVRHRFYDRALIATLEPGAATLSAE
jgi:SAM-dependent methyltransferase